MAVIFPYIGKFITPTDELIFFRGVSSNRQPVAVVPGQGWLSAGAETENSWFGSEDIPHLQSRKPKSCGKILVNDGLLLGGDWNMAGKNDFAIILGMSSS